MGADGFTAADLPDVQELRRREAAALGRSRLQAGVLLVGEDNEHDKLLVTETADKYLLIEHLLNDHDAPERRANIGMNERSLVVAHLARHPKTSCPVDIVGPIPEGGIVVIRGGEQFDADVVGAMLEELLRVADHDRFTVMLLNSESPGAVAVIDARMDIDEIRSKLGVE